jgi:uncharacterized membrane protein YhaH (DUF805 family)
MNVFSFKGRIGRLSYFYSTVGYLIFISITILLYYLGISIPSLITLIGGLWMYVAQGVKRCHDLGVSGWYQIIPFYNLWMLIVKGNDGGNHYGPEPKNK